MDTRTIATIPAIVIALMIAASLYALSVLPGDVVVLAHFGFNGKPDILARPRIVFSIMPAVAIVLMPLLLLWVRRARIAVSESRAVFWIALGAPLALLAIAHGLLVAYSLGIHLDVRRMWMLAIGLILIVNGNALGKIRRNHGVGIRTRYTMRDEWVWDRTQRFSGWVFVGAGTGLSLCALVIPAGPVLMGIELAAIAVILIAPARKSVLLWRERNRLSS